MAKQESRKARVTRESQEEARRLSALWASRKHATQAEFGETYDIGNQSAVGQFLRGETPLSLKAARGFAKGLNCEIAEFSPRLAAEAAKNAEFIPSAEDDPFVAVKQVDVVLSAGHGATAQVEEVVGHLKFTKQFLRSVGVSAAAARVVNVRGPSMEPTIKDGSVLLVNINHREPAVNAIYALSRPSEGLIVKRLVKVAGKWVARSDNRDFQDIVIDRGEPLTIIGRAVWMGVKL